MAARLGLLAAEDEIDSRQHHRDFPLREAPDAFGKNSAVDRDDLRHVHDRIA